MLFTRLCPFDWGYLTRVVREVTGLGTQVMFADLVQLPEQFWHLENETLPICTAEQADNVKKCSANGSIFPQRAPADLHQGTKDQS